MSTDLRPLLLNLLVNQRQQEARRRERQQVQEFQLGLELVRSGVTDERSLRDVTQNLRTGQQNQLVALGKAVKEREKRQKQQQEQSQAIAPALTAAETSLLEGRPQEFQSLVQALQSGATDAGVRSNALNQLAVLAQAAPVLRSQQERAAASEARTKAREEALKEQRLAERPARKILATEEFINQTAGELRTELDSANPDPLRINRLASRLESLTALQNRQSQGDAESITMDLGDGKSVTINRGANLPAAKRFEIEDQFRFLDNFVEDLDRAINIVGESPAGTAGAVVDAIARGTGIVDDLLRFVASDRRVDPEVLDAFFDSNLPEAQVLENILAYGFIRINRPDRRITNRSMERALDQVRIVGGRRSARDVVARLRAVRRQAIRARRQSRERVIQTNPSFFSEGRSEDLTTRFERLDPAAQRFFGGLAEDATGGEAGAR